MKPKMKAIVDLMIHMGMIHTLYIHFMYFLISKYIYFFLTRTPNTNKCEYAYELVMNRVIYKPNDI